MNTPDSLGAESNTEPSFAALLLANAAISAVTLLARRR
jgi:hypothetical protein